MAGTKCTQSTRMYFIFFEGLDEETTTVVMCEVVYGKSCEKL